MQYLEVISSLYMWFRFYLKLHKQLQSLLRLRSYRFRCTFYVYIQSAEHVQLQLFVPTFKIRKYTTGKELLYSWDGKIDALYILMKYTINIKAHAHTHNERRICITYNMLDCNMWDAMLSYIYVDLTVCQRGSIPMHN